ncbi:MAG: hypothetical protein AB1649_18380 [Chloroflexota bacterium]
MTNLNDRIKRVIEELAGNESLLGMLDTDAASEMLKWGTALAAALVQRTQDLDDLTADLALLPRLKAIRQAMRSIGNWAAGKYVDPADRVELRDKLLGHFRLIFGDDAPVPPAEKMDEVLNQVDQQDQTPHQLISNMRTLLEPLSPGGSHAETQTSTPKW